MKNHIQIYFKYFNYDVTDFIACEVCDKPSVDIHHIKPKGMGGTAGKDTIENLIALCRSCHVDAHASKISKDELTKVHNIWMHT